MNLILEIKDLIEKAFNPNSNINQDALDMLDEAVGLDEVDLQDTMIDESELNSSDETNIENVFNNNKTSLFHWDIHDINV